MTQTLTLSFNQLLALKSGISCAKGYYIERARREAPPAGIVVETDDPPMQETTQRDWPLLYSIETTLAVLSMVVADLDPDHGPAAKLLAVEIIDESVDDDFDAPFVSVSLPESSLGNLARPALLAAVWAGFRVDMPRAERHLIQRLLGDS